MATVAPWVPLTPLAQRTPSGPGELRGCLPGAEASDEGTSATTIALVGGPALRRDPSAMALRLVELAISDELVVVYGGDETGAEIGIHAVVAGMREMLPRYTIVTFHLAPRDHPLWMEMALLDDCLDVGTLPVVVTRSNGAGPLAAELYHRLGADRVLEVFLSATGELDLHDASPDRSALAPAVVHQEAWACAG